MHAIEIGKRLRENVAKYEEGSVLEYMEDGPILFLYAARPTEVEIQAVRKGKLEFAAYETDYLLWFLCKIHGFGPWSDAPFSIRMYDDMKREFDWSEEIEDGTGLALHIILTDASNGVVKMQRLVALPTKFSREFRAMILRQLERPFSRQAYHREIDKVYATLGTKELVARADIKCRQE